ncbi:MULTISPECIES: maleylpyruvate isomerase family mycothiol-dependent enzyme [unclassified Streptomyces]|uniref:maleylpyruvate isomerase family mycothiol-dependent enzyme n=1 Tax=unclassified Streptomyces TaxID=2593676 RepID=UPI002E2C218B|nr:maleylpyruvate isomerase family mycothiol-dependent enzyme [Streptomyces sp. NBC_01423]WSX90740.1 maleylpyruvate isomerase family mycothiol-dependent enzyme [Streptomyces sp. NBC_00891]WSY09755.1 maleylpyruvate isomerase family mycothiol-dependent enzyme [Streptomyces sp. NBC_00890]WSZ06845.1 maleylpyruvate isomerase family mycothiol-dependent enzyme [Streptomyces sp. NBC_00869]WSZ27637.1 maleylpyruvate isomerase family mycothiol-dependent enzyme [Streptomyces sp. NBC_00870]
MALLAHERYCDEIVRLTGELRAAIRGADLGATVPTCPDWTLRELAEHVGRAHRWAGEIVRTRATEEVADEKVPDNSPAGDDPAALDAWLAEGAAGTADALREAGPDAQVWSWAWDRSAGFWARRMAIETVVHLADAALAAQVPYTMAPELAADTVEEWLQIVAYAQKVGYSGSAELPRDGRTLHLHATDAPGAEWLIELGADGVTWSREHGKADVALRGPLTDVMLVFNRRLAVGSDRVEVLGDAGLLNSWLERTSFE